MEADQEQRGGVPFLTSSRGVPPPLVTTHYRVQDDGMNVWVWHLYTVAVVECHVTSHDQQLCL